MFDKQGGSSRGGEEVKQRNISGGSGREDTGILYCADVRSVSRVHPLQKLWIDPLPMCVGKGKSFRCATCVTCWHSVGRGERFVRRGMQTSKKASFQKDMSVKVIF